MNWHIVVLGLAQVAAGGNVMIGPNNGITLDMGKLMGHGARPLPLGSSFRSADQPSLGRKSKQADQDLLDEQKWQPLSPQESDVAKLEPKIVTSSVDVDTEGRKMRKKKRLLLSLLVGLKVLAAGILLPSILALALYASWKGVTISLLAFMLAATVGVKSLLKGKEEKHHVILAKPAPSVHEHIWRKDEEWFEKDHSPYRAYSSRKIDDSQKI